MVANCGVIKRIAAAMKTQIFESYSAFLSREDKDLNGVSKQFAESHPNYEVDNETNKACWNCSDCSGCSDCSDCSDCLHKSNIKGTNSGQPAFEVPVIENIHQKVYEASHGNKALDMRKWHVCGTSPLPCRLGCSLGWKSML